jgi:hypothetical protein
LPRVVAKNLPDLRDEDAQIGVADESSGPDAIVDLGLGDDVRPPIEEQPEQIEGLRGDVHSAAALEQLARLGIENEGAEGHSHGRCVEGRSLGNPWNSLETLS